VRVAQFKQNGHLYVASHYVGVFASLFGFRFKELIPISHIIEIKSDDDRRKLTVKFRSDKSAKHNQSEEKKLKVRHSNVVLKTEQNACIQRIKH
jgi:hypothetical protein